MKTKYSFSLTLIYGGILLSSILFTIFAIVPIFVKILFFLHQVGINNTTIITTTCIIIVIWSVITSTKIVRSKRIYYHNKPIGRKELKTYIKRLEEVDRIQKYDNALFEILWEKKQTNFEN